MDASSTSSLAYHSFSEVIATVLSSNVNAHDRASFWADVVRVPLEQRQTIVNEFVHDCIASLGQTNHNVELVGRLLGGVLMPMLPMGSVAESLEKFVDLLTAGDADDRFKALCSDPHEGPVRVRQGVLNTLSHAFNTEVMRDVTPGQERPTVAFSETGKVSFHLTTQPLIPSLNIAPDVSTAEIETILLADLETTVTKRPRMTR